MEQFKDMLRDVMTYGTPVEYRNGVRITLLDKQFKHDLSTGFPLITIKETMWKAAFDEMLWFISGSTDISKLRYRKTWEQWALTSDKVKGYSKNRGIINTIGPIYGASYRNAPNSNGYVREQYEHSPVSGIAPDVLKRYENTSNKEAIYRALLTTSTDQLFEVIQNIKMRPGSTRHRICVYNTDYLPDEGLDPVHNVSRGRASLTPCNVFQQYHVLDNKLHATFTQASWDLLIGASYNIAQFALLLTLISREVGLTPGILTINGGNVHIYKNQVEAMLSSKLLDKEPLPLPSIEIADKSIYDIGLDDIKINGYVHHGRVKIPVS